MPSCILNWISSPENIIVTKLWPSTQHRVTDLVSFLFLFGNHTRAGASAVAPTPHYNSQNAPLIGGRFRACVPAPLRQDRVLFSGCLLQGFLRPGSCVQETRSGAMSRLGSVQRKMPCVFVTEVKAEPSAKREHQVPGDLGCWAASPALRGGPGALQVLQGRFG